ncbi:MAG: YitT family protein [Brevibacillus sp.]|nr:YitT family protein [Brevibacillus sp.]
MTLLHKALSTLLGCFLVGVGVNAFLVPHQLMDGGMIGIGLLANYYFEWPSGLVILVCSLPIYLMVFLHDRELFYHSFHGLLLSSFLIDALSGLRTWGYVFSMETSSVIGGALIGSGIGIMLAYKTNTGGTDLLAQFIARRLNYPVALLIFFIDGFIVGLSFHVNGLEGTVFSLLTITTVAVCTHYFSQMNKHKSPYIVVGPLFGTIRIPKEKS